MTDSTQQQPTPTIPAESVEAAARAAYEVNPVELFGREHPITWEQLSDSQLGQRCKDNELEKARAALEAAAPYMLAGAWDKAYVLGAADDRKAQNYAVGGPDFTPATNPYRTSE